MKIKVRNKEKQSFNPNLKYSKNHQIVSCFEHFKERYSERLGGCLGYKDYWDVWISNLRGKYVTEKDDMMYRMIGNYPKGEKIFKLVYKKIKPVNIYVPLTIFELEDHKVKYRYFLKSINWRKNK